MPLSEHEQRMLEQIENALYAEDPKFASTVRGARLRSASGRRKLQAGVLLVVGLVLLVAGIALPVKPAGFPIISLLGFLVMFGSGVLLMLGGGRVTSREQSAGNVTSLRGRTQRRGGGFSARMEERFRRRFEE